jgi:hypothetical protein
VARELSTWTASLDRVHRVVAVDDQVHGLDQERGPELCLPRPPTPELPRERSGHHDGRRPEQGRERAP